MGAPFITIGIASYNYAKLLPRAFEAIRRQKYKDFEVLYCDDGSTDESRDVILGFIKNNPDMLIRLISGDNEGVQANKNRILENALGEYVMLCDADDWMDDNCLYTLATMAAETKADRVISGFRNVIENNGSLSIGQIEFLPATPSKWNQFFHHGCLYRREVYEKNGIYFRTDHYPDDFDFVERYNLCSGSAAFVYEVTYNYYHNGTNTSSTANPTSRWYYLNQYRDIAQLTSEIVKYLEIGGDDYNELQMAIMRIFFADLQYVRDRQEYTELRRLLQYAAPKYWKNPLLFSRNTPYRPDTARRAKILIILDRLGMLYPVSVMLHALTGNN